MSKTRGKRLLAVVMSVLMIMTLLPTGMFAEDSYTYSYTFNDVTLGGYGHNAVLDEDSGAVTLTYSGQYQELQFALPSELNANSLLSISFDVASGETSDLAVKVIATDNSNDIVGWGSSSKALTDDEITTVSAAESVTIGLMYNGAGTDVEYVITGFTVTTSEEATSSGDSGDTGVTFDEGEYDLTGYTLSYSADINLASSSWDGYTFSDTAIVDAMETEGSLLVVTRSTSVAGASADSYDKVGIVDAYWGIGNWVSFGTAISPSTESDPVDIECLFDNSITVVYDGTTIYNTLVAAGFYGSNCGPAQFITNSGETYTITNVSVYVPEGSVDPDDDDDDTAIWTITRDEWEENGFASLEFALSDYCDNADEIVSGDNVTINVTVESDGTYFMGTIGVVAPDDTSEGTVWADAGALETATYTDVWTFTTDVAYDYAQVQVWWMNSDCTYFSITDISVTVNEEEDDSTTDDILAANQELIATLSELLETDEVMYIDQLGSNDDYGWYDYFLTVYYGEVHPNWDEIVASWISSLGDEANIGLAATVYQAPVAGTEDDPDGTDGLLTMSYVASVGSEEDGTYVESDYYYVDVIIKATQLYYVDLPDEEGFTVTSDKTYATEGEEVTLTLTLSEGYCLNYFQVWYMDDDGNYCIVDEVTDNGDETYTFNMPAHDVWLNVYVGSLTINYDFNVGGYVSGESYANEGEWVYVSVWAMRGYELGEVTAVDENGDSVALELQSWTYTLDFGDGPMTAYTYLLIMPDSAVTVTITFEEIEGFTNNIIIINDNYSYTYIEDVDFTDEDTYLELTYILNDEDKGDWEFGAVYSCSWNYMFNLSSYNGSYGTYAISLADLAALVAEYGYDANDGIMIQLWDDGDGDYITLNSAALVTGYYSVDVVDNDGITWVEIGGVRKEGGTVYVDVDVAEGYIIKSVSAVDANGNEVELTRNYMGSWDADYTFIMPDADVTITFETVAQSELTTIVTESDDGGIYVSTEYGSPIFYSQYVDFTDENLYITITYEALSSEYDGYTVAVVAYGDENYDGSHDYDADSTLYQDVLRIVDNGTGTVSVALTDIQAAVDASGIAGGNYYLWAYTGEFNITSVSVETLDTYTPAESSVGEIVTINGVEYEIVWDTTTPNPTGNWYSVNNIVGRSTSTYTDWWTIYDSFKNSVVSHLDDSSLIQVVTDETIDYDLGVWLQLNVGDYHILYAGMNYVDNTAYIRLDEVSAVAVDDGYEITTDTINSLIAGDFYLNDTVTAGITAVRILTPHEYEESYWTWSEDYSSATLTFVCTEGTHTVDVEAFVGSDTTDATCTEDGEIVYNAAATYDGVVYTTSETVVIPATGHDWSVSYEWSEDGSTCTATHVCANDASHNVTVDATVTSEVTTDPTCEDMGTTTYTATFDVDWAEPQTKDVVDVEAIGHDWTVTYSWSEDGSTCTATHICANDASHNVTVDATVTSEVTVDPTCVDMGTTTYTATFAEEWAETQTKDLVDIDATGHTNSEPVEENRTEATCTVDGSYESVVYCSVCNAEISRETVTIPVTGHTPGEELTENNVEPTCTVDGSYDIATYCTVCGEETSRTTVTVPATGHTNSEAVKENVVAHTDTTDGSYDVVVYCSVCGEEVSRETVTVPAGHDWDEGTVTTEPTCSEAGVKTYTCSVCGDTYTEPITATGHTQGEAVRENYVAPTVTEDGSYELVTYCSVCGEEISRETVVVPATGEPDLSTIRADYTAVKNAIAKANALNPDDYINFSDVTAAINSVNWTYSVAQQSAVAEMASKIEKAIANLISADTVSEEVTIIDPIEDTDTQTEDDETEPEVEPEVTATETNPTTGIAISLLPMVIAALTAVSSKRK